MLNFERDQTWKKKIVYKSTQILEATSKNCTAWCE